MARIIVIDASSSAILQALAQYEDFEYAFLLPEGFTWAYDDALSDVLNVADGHDAVCFSTEYSRNKQNKFDLNRNNPILNPSPLTIMGNPSGFLSCVFSRNVLSCLSLRGANSIETIIYALLEVALKDCLFVDMAVLSSGRLPEEINGLVDSQKIQEFFFQRNPFLAKDIQANYSRFFPGEDEFNVLRKLEKTWLFKSIMWARKSLKALGFYSMKASYKHRKYLKAVRVKDSEKKEEIAQKIQQLPYDILQRHDRRADVIVSLTTHGDRLSASAPYAIYSIFTQTILPSHIVLSIDGSKWNEGNLPPLIKRLQRSGLEVLFCRDVRSHTKLLPALAKYPDFPIITVDDDMVYAPQAIEELVSEYSSSDKKTVFCRLGVYPHKRDGKYVPYMEWTDSQSIIDSAQNKFTLPVSPYGVHGVIYPPRIFDSEVFNDTVFLKLAPHTDDIWFWVMELRNRVNTSVIPSSTQKEDSSVSLIEYLEESESSALYFQNCFGGRNDREMRSLLDYYSLD